MEKSDAVVLGRKIGTFEDWDDLETNAMVLYGFEPLAGVNIPAGDINILYDEGIVEVCDDQGETTFSADIVQIVKGLPVIATGASL